MISNGFRVLLQRRIQHMTKKSTKKKNSLGKGLSALLHESGVENTNLIPKDSINNIQEIQLHEIETNPFQPRTDFNQQALQELAASIKIQGIIQPITVRLLTKNRYQIISGERRFQASKQAGLKTIPAYIRKANDQQMLEMALIENIQRENLNAIEIALSYQRLITECNLKQEELSNQVGKDRTTVTNYLRLLKLPPDIQIAVRDQKLTMGHARALLGIDNIDLQLNIFKKIIKEELSVRKTEELVRELSEHNTKKITKNTVKNTSTPDRELTQLQSKLCSHLGTKVEIKSSDNKKGEIKIPFASVDDLNRILEILDII
jgi:ParB family chromosome partitioning protein